MRLALRARLGGSVVAVVAAAMGVVLALRAGVSSRAGQRAAPNHATASTEPVDHADGRTVDVAVVDDSGRPVRGASVCLSAPTSADGSAAGASTGEDGRADAPWPDGMEYAIVVEKPEHDTVRMTSRARELTVTLTRCGRIEGSVYELESGNAVSDVVLRILPHRPEGATETRPAVRADGRWQAVGVSAGQYSVVVTPRRHIPYQIADALVRPGETTEVDLPLTTGLLVRGTVVDLETGRPITCGTIGDSDCRSNEGAPLDGEGRFVIQGRTDSIERFRVWAPGWSNAVIEADPKELFDFHGVQTVAAVVAVPRAGTVTGTVVDCDSIPIPGATVVLAPSAIVRAVERVDRGEPGSNRTVWATTDTRGEFALPRWHDWPTVGQLLVRRDGYAPRVLRAPNPSDGPITVRLGPGARLVLTVRDPQRKPAAGASCQLLLRDPQDDALIGDIRGARAGLSTGDDGRLSVGYLCGGRWVACVMSKDRSAGAEAEILVEEDGHVDLTMDLHPVDRVFGRVLDEVGHPFADATVMLSPHTQVARTDDDGRFLFAPVTEQQTTLSIWCPELRDRASKHVTRNVESVITLERKAAFRRQLLLVLDDSTLEPIRWGSVRITVDSAWARDIPFACGRVELPVPVDGKGSIRCSALGYEDATGEFPSLGDDPHGVRVLLRKRVAEPPRSGVTLSLKLRRAEPPVWIGLYDATTMQRLPPARRMSDEEYLFSWPMPLRILVVASCSSGYVAPMLCELGPGDVAERSLVFTAGGGTIAGASRGSRTVILRDSNGVERVVSVHEDGRFAVGKVAPGTYWLRAAGSDWTAVEINDGERLEIDLR